MGWRGRLAGAGHRYLPLPVRRWLAQRRQGWTRPEVQVEAARGGSVEHLRWRRGPAGSPRVQARMTVLESDSHAGVLADVRVEPHAAYRITATARGTPGALLEFNDRARDRRPIIGGGPVADWPTDISVIYRPPSAVLRLYVCMTTFSGCPRGFIELSDLVVASAEERFRLRRWPPARPLVSVVIPCYNYGRYVEEAIDSVLAQTLQDVDIIVVDDGSTDPETNALLGRLAKPRTRVVRFRHAGLSATRNRGIRLARGKYVCCLDADDTLEPTYLEKAVSLMEAMPGVGFVYSWVRRFGDEEGIWYTEAFDLRKLLHYNHIAVAAVFRHAAWRRVGGYWEQMREGYEDWEFWIRLGAAGYRGQLIPEPLFNYRRHGDTMIHAAAKQHQVLAERIRRRHAKLLTARAVRDVPPREEPAAVEVPFLNLRRPAQFRRPVGGTRHLVVIAPWLTAGGAEAILYQIVSDLARGDGYECTLVTSLPTGYEWFDRFYAVTPYIYTLPHMLPEQAWEDYVVNAVGIRGADTVLISGSRFGYRVLPQLAAARPEIRIVDLIHNESEFGTLREAFEHDRFIDQHITVSERIRQRLLMYGLPGSKVRTVYNGVDASGRFNPERYDRERERDRFGLPAGKRIATFVGRLHRLKGPEDFLRLAAGLQSRDRLHFVLAGDGELSGVVGAQIQRLDLAQQVTWVKGLPTDDIPRLLAASDALILPSRLEGFPLVVLEALAMGVPVLAYDVGEVRTAVLDGQTGYVVDTGRVDQLAMGLDRLLRDDQLWDRMKHAARMVVFERGFTLDRMLAEYRQVLR